MWNKLTQLLYPKGYAYRLFEWSNKLKFEKALTKQTEQTYNSIIHVQNSFMPDNTFFITEDAVKWESVLGVFPPNGATLNERKSAIFQKLASPNNTESRNTLVYMQFAIQLAGFNLYLHKSNGQSPDFVANTITQAQHGDFQHGQITHGAGFTNIVANSVEASTDATFDIGTNYNQVFYIGASVRGDFANVSMARQEELRRLILNLKPVESIAFLFINYV